MVAPCRSGIPRTPLLLLFLVALDPGRRPHGLLLWSDTKADEYEAFAAVDEAATTTTIAGEATVPTPVVTPLRTGLLDYRRAPDEPWRAVASANALAEQVEQIYGYVDDRSCVVGVGRTAGTSPASNETTPVIPASNQKLLVAAVALEVLGADYRYVTRVTGPPAVDGVIDGDVYLIGGGDPLLTVIGLSARPTTPSPRSTSRRSMRSPTRFVAAGVTRINGSLIGDGTPLRRRVLRRGRGATASRSSRPDRTTR